MVRSFRFGRLSRQILPFWATLAGLAPSENPMIMGCVAPGLGDAIADPSAVRSVWRRAAERGFFCASVAAMRWSGASNTIRCQLGCGTRTPSWLATVHPFRARMIESRLATGG